MGVNSARRDRSERVLVRPIAACANSALRGGDLHHPPQAGLRGLARARMNHHQATACTCAVLHTPSPAGFYRLLGLWDIAEAGAPLS